MFYCVAHWRILAMKIYLRLSLAANFIFHVSLNAKQMCRVSLSHERSLGRSNAVEPMRRFHSFIVCLWGAFSSIVQSESNSKHIQLRNEFNCCAFPNMRHFLSLRINISRLISPVIYALERRTQACSYDDSVHASAAFIASNSFTFISRLMLRRSSPSQLQLN